MPDYTSQFRAFYDPNLRTENTFGGPGVAYGPGSEGMAGGGGFDMNSLLATVYAYKQRAAEAAARRDRVAADEAVQRQKDALSRNWANGQSMSPAEMASQANDQKMRSFWETKQALDSVQSRDPWAGTAHGQAQGMTMFNMPAASALTFGKDVFPNGFDVYSDIAKSSGGADPRSQAIQGNATSKWGQGY